MVYNTVLCAMCSLMVRFLLLFAKCQWRLEWMKDARFYKCTCSIVVDWQLLF